MLPQSELPSEVPFIDDAVAVTAGGDHACVRTQAGRVICWGRNDKGQCGPINRDPIFPPIEIRTLSNVTALSAGDRFSCATVADGSILCWGAGRYHGQLGDGFNQDSAQPVHVIGF